MRARRLEDRRRQCVTELTVASAVAGYAAARLADCGPVEARMSALQAAQGLEDAARALRKLAAMPPAQRRPVSAALTADGMSLGQVAALLGVSKALVVKDVRAAGNSGTR